MARSQGSLRCGLSARLMTGLGQRTNPLARERAARSGASGEGDANQLIDTR